MATPSSCHTHLHTLPSPGRRGQTHMSPPDQFISPHLRRQQLSTTTGSTRLGRDWGHGQPVPRLEKLRGAGVKVVLVNKLQARIYIKIIIKCIYPRIKLWICLWAGHRAVGRAAKRCARPFQVAKAAGWLGDSPTRKKDKRTIFMKWTKL